jgi:protein tyrosine phosphatase (PTP) superfamily phosphohydrolase (DUF442 family)
MRAGLAATLLLLAAPLSVGPGPGRGVFAPTPVEAAGLHNVYRLTPGLFSGSSPDGPAGFASLRALGVRTVISVDGTTPEVTDALKYGLRYVHLPVGYDGVPRDKGLAVAKAVRELPGPVYLHCHHGKHRGPAAAICGVLALDPSVTPDEAASWLKTAGTDPKYAGLIAVPHTFARPTAAELARLPGEFPATAPVPDLARLMVDIDGKWDRLKAGDRGQAVPLAELYREAARLPDSGRRGAEFVAWLKEAEAAADELAKPEAKLATSQRLCHRCHEKYRDR